MAEYLELHPRDPQPRLIRKAAEIVRAGGVIAYPTDSCYALGCHIGDKDALERIRRIREADRHHHFTLVCRDLAEIGRYARVDTPQFRLLKSATPGPFTFLLPATRETPKRLQHPKRRTIGIRVPEHRVPHLLLAELAEPLLSSTLLLPGDELPLTDGEQIRARLEHQIDAVLDGGHCGVEPTTVVDLTVMPATRETPRRLQHEKRRTVGIRVPDHPVPQLLLAELGEPLMSSTLILPGDELPLTDGQEIRARLEHQIDAVLDGGHCGIEPTTVVDLAVDPPVILRRGTGDLSRLGL